MGAITLTYRSELRRRWRSWVAVAVLVAVVGGVVLAAGAAGRRTAAAVPGYVAAHGFDAELYATGPLAGIGRLPGVTAWSVAAVPANGDAHCACTPRTIQGNDISLALLPTGGPAPERLVSGHLPDPAHPYDVVASYTLEHDVGLRLGSTITTPFYAASQEQAYNLNSAPPPPRGPTVSFTVVGFTALETDFPTGGAPEYFLFAPSSLRRALGGGTFFGDAYFVRLKNGAAGLARFESAAERLAPSVVFVQPENVQVQAVESSIHPQAVGWWVLALLAALVGLGVIGQTLGRQALVEGEEYPTMAAVGMDRRQLLALGMARNLGIGVCGALGALLAAYLLSPIAPLGEARLAEGSTGLRFDPLVLPLGAVAVVAAVGLLGLWPALRASRRPRGLPGRSRSSAVAKWVASVGAPPSAVVGVRNALERRSGGATVPVGSALVGTILAVTALVGTSVFAGSLDHLLVTPRLYGDAFAFKTTNPGLGAPPVALVDALRRDPAVSGVTEGFALPAIAIDNVTVGAVAVTPIKGEELFSIVTGHLPAGPRQVALGATTMHALGVGLGSTVRVRTASPEGGQHTETFVVVGQVALPVLGQVVGLGNGSLFTVTGYLSAACPATTGRQACVASETGNGGGLLVQVVPGPAGRAAAERYLGRLGPAADVGTVPSSLINFGEAVDFPVIFGVMLAAFGVATLLHLLVVSVARRRREVGLLKVVGFVNRQVAAAVGWQASTLATLGIVVGVPAGLAVGEAVWRSFASTLGAVPVAVVPPLAPVAVALGVLVVANLVAMGPALVATGSRPSDLLRTA